MAGGASLPGVVGSLDRLFTSGSVAGLTEAGLLERFVNDRDESAFEAIVARHGPMVLGVCRGRLRDPRDVEDAFQATFLVLARRAGSIKQPERLGNWLFGTATRVALRARSLSARRVTTEVLLEDVVETTHADVSIVFENAVRAELRGRVQEELARLPSLDRTAVLLCCLEGLTHEQAADRLGWPLGTLKGRVARGKERLRRRLERRGITFTAGTLVANLARDASVALPKSLLHNTIRAVFHAEASRAVTLGLISSTTLTLTQGALSAMFTSNLLVQAGLAATATLTAVSIGVASFDSSDDNAPLPPPARAAIVGEVVSGLAPSLAGAQSRTIGKSKAAPKHEEALAPPIRIAQLTQPPSQPQPPLRSGLVEPLFGGLADVPESTRVPSDIKFMPLPSQLEKALEANDLIPQIARDRQEYVQLRAIIRRERLRRMLEKLDTNSRSKSAYAKLEQVIDFPFKAETPLEEAIACLEETTKGP
ncbi:MAG: RNA polymerase sigma factor, partial [Planctomycetota bacterium]|nr:RNA polymerase sigma factor [Planctomycetota bacterium]